jgi:small-conductance mechanosensitive channel
MARPQLFDPLFDLVPVAVVAVVSAAIVWAVLRSGRGKAVAAKESRIPRQIAVVVLVTIGVVVGILVLPMEQQTKTQLLSLFGLALTAIIAFSSTTLVTNAMAGLMLRAIGNFHSGDFIRVGEHFGRVSEQGLFHTEIQTAIRDLTALPNAYLVSNPVTVVRSSGTIIETTLTIGYDVPHAQVEKLLVDAAGKAELEDAFVQVLELGNHAITYRVSGFLSETKRLVSAGSVLRRAVLDTLHSAGVEIASPNIMVQRPLRAGERLVPRPAKGKAQEAAAPAPGQATAEELAFDKADEAERIGSLRFEQGELAKSIKALEKVLAEAENETEKGQRASALERAKLRREEIAAELEAEDVKK